MYLIMELKENIFQPVSIPRGFICLSNIGTLTETKSTMNWLLDHFYDSDNPNKEYKIVKLIKVIPNIFHKLNPNRFVLIVTDNGKNSICTISNTPLKLISNYNDTFIVKKELERLYPHCNYTIYEVVE